MRQEIQIPKNVRLFKRRDGTNQLSRSGDYLEQGDVVTIGDPESLVYDHRYQSVVPLIEPDGIHRYLIVEELGLPELV